MMQDTAAIRIGGVSVYDARFIFLLAALCVYALGGTPTPDSPGMPELVIGLFLLVAAGGWKAAGVFLEPLQPGQAWFDAGRILLFYGLCVPLLGGFLRGNDSGLVLRDLVAFLFFLMPLFFYDLAVRRDHYRTPLTVSALFIGMMFSLRLLSPLFALMGGYTWRLLPMADPGYLANAPTVLFTTLFLVGYAGFLIFRSGRAISVMRALLLVLLASVPLAAMAMVNQRASMGVLVGAVAILAFCGLYRSPARMVLPLGALLILALAAGDVVMAIGHNATEKTNLVGFNMRWQEAAAVMKALTPSPFAVLFGNGWGATVASPAVGGMTVNFTHSLLTTYWLKTGIVGLCLAVCYLFSFARLLARLFLGNPVMALALAGPFLIDVALYASFKSLDFGILLLLIALWGKREEEVASASRL